MPDEIRTIYGDPSMTVQVSPTRVIFRHGAERIYLSRAEFREIVLAWERLLETEQD